MHGKKMGLFIGSIIAAVIATAAMIHFLSEKTGAENTAERYRSEMNSLEYEYQQVYKEYEALYEELESTYSWSDFGESIGDWVGGTIGSFVGGFVGSKMDEYYGTDEDKYRIINQIEEKEKKLSALQDEYVYAQDSESAYLRNAGKYGTLSVVSIVMLCVSAAIAAAVLISSKKEEKSISGGSTANDLSDPQRTAVQPSLPVYNNNAQPVSEKKPIIISYSEQHGGGSVHIHRGSEVRIGRDPEKCSIIYKDGTSGVSGLHCSVNYDFGRNEFVVTDLGSTYGTYLMPEAKRLEKGKPYYVKRGQMLSIGDPQNSIKLDIEQN